MKEKEFSEEELNKLCMNPNVLYVKKNRIIYSEDFKEHFLKDYDQGKKPSQIFLEAGFDVDLLGTKRIERASARWRDTSNKKAAKGERQWIEVHENKKPKTMSREEIQDAIRRIEKELDYLKQFI